MMWEVLQCCLNSKDQKRLKKKQAVTTGTADSVESRSKDMELSQQQEVEGVSNFDVDRLADVLEENKRVNPKGSAKQFAKHKSATSIASDTKGSSKSK